MNEQPTAPTVTVEQAKYAPYMCQVRVCWVDGPTLVDGPYEHRDMADFAAERVRLALAPLGNAWMAADVRKAVTAQLNAEDRELATLREVDDLRAENERLSKIEQRALAARDSNSAQTTDWQKGVYAISRLILGEDAGS